LFDVFIPETDLDVTAVKVARTVHMTNLQAEARLSSFVLPKSKSHGDTTRSRKFSFVAVVGFKEPGVPTEQSSEASEESVVVVGHQVTRKNDVEYLVKGTQEPDGSQERMSIWLL